MNTAPIKTCDHCQHTGTMPTFRDGETICIDCMEKSANMSRGKYLALLAEVEQLKKGVELRDQQNADLHDMIADVHQERDQLKTEIAHLQIEVNNLRGLKPEIPPMPGEDWPRELPRYILRENGPRRPRSVPHKDGYWTPWYLANRQHEVLEREQAAARTACANWGKAMEECYQLKAAVALAVDAFKRYEIDVETYPTTEHVSMMRNLEGVLAARDAEVIEREAKPIATEFFRWWYNQPGSNTDQGFDEWWQLRQQAKEVQS